MISFLAFTSAPAEAQYVIKSLGKPAPIVGGSSGLPAPPVKPSFGAGIDLVPQQHKHQSGRPCVTVHGFSQNQIVNAAIYDHILVIANICSQPIRLNVCYHRSNKCRKLIVKGYHKTQELLGVSPGEKDFRFEYSEEFS